MQQLAVFSTSAKDGVTEAALRALMATAGCAPDADTEICCLADNRAYEVAVGDALTTDGAVDRMIAALRPPADAAGIDVNIVPDTNRRKRLLIADMDSTIITSESLDDMAVMAGLAEQVLPVTRRAMNGELDFTAALDARIALFAGQKESLLQDALEDAVLTSGAKTLVRTMRANGGRAYLVSGGFTAITGPIAAACGFDGHHANQLELSGGVLTGRVLRPILDRDAKARHLHHYCNEMEIDASAAAAIGDGSNDLAMLTGAGFGVAFHGKPALRQQVQLQLNHTDLTGLLYLQGYRACEFVTG